LSPEDVAYHREQTAIAEELYKDAASPSGEAAMWRNFKWQSRRAIKIALRETDYLRAIPRALERSARATRVLRFLMAPPKSQDQFHLLCKAYGKGSENSGSPISSERALAIDAAFSEWRDIELSSWLDSNRSPSLKEIRAVFLHAAPMMAQQKIQTQKRMDASAFQEQSVADLLLDDDWTYQSARTIDRAKGIERKHFLQKARFTAGSRTKEIDVAIGLGQAFILALECKVSNDSTNSTKRLNDISEKADAWRAEYGRTLKTGAMLQGVYRADDVLELAQGGVEVFWLHDLPRFARWVSAELRD
jgi:hypothetical protein